MQGFICSILIGVVLSASTVHGSDIVMEQRISSSNLNAEMQQDGTNNPGVDVRISEKALNYAFSVAVKQLSELVKDIHIPDSNGRADTPIGHVDYYFTNIRVVGYDPPTTSAKLSTGSVITWNIDNLYVKIEGDWRYKYKKAFVKISDHGTVSIKAHVNANVAINLGANANGFPTMSCKTCTVNVHSVDVKFHGGASWLYNLFSKSVESTLKHQLNDQLTAQVTDFINNKGNAQLAKIKLTTTIDKKYELDYALVKAPLTTASYIQTFHKGEVFLKGSRTEAPFSAKPLPDIDTGKMVTFFISDYLVNTLTYSMYKNNQFDYVISKDTVPANYTDFLKTSDCLTCLGSLIPQLKNKYPGRFVMMKVKPNEPPQVEMTSSGIVLDVSGNVTVYVQPKDDTEKPTYVFTVTIKASGVLKPWVNGNTVHWSIDDVKNKMDITDSAIGDISEWALDLLFKIAFGLLKADINVEGKDGIELPVHDDFTLLTPEMQLFDDGLLVASDVTYNPK